MHWKPLAIIVSALLLVGMGTVSAQSDTGKPLTQELQINSKALNEVRLFSISLPDDYYNSDKTYPVLYLLDGRTHFQHATGAARFLADKGSIPDIIVISIHNVDRNRDFSPAYDERIPTSGGADRFLDFMEDELSVFLEKNYRLSPYSVLMGHSFGGTLAVHALSTRPGLFDAFIAVSPYLQFKDNYVINEAEKLVKPYGRDRKSFYLTVGDEPDYFAPIDEFSAVVEKRAEGTIDYRAEKILTENHATIPYISLFNGLKFVFSDWQVPPGVFNEGLEAIDRHIAMTSSKYGMDIQAPEYLINRLGYLHLQNNEIKKAIAVFSENVKRYPGSANVYDSLGDAYERNGQLKQAGDNYQKAVNQSSLTNDPNHSVYLNNLLRVRKELESQQ